MFTTIKHSSSELRPVEIASRQGRALLLHHITEICSSSGHEWVSRNLCNPLRNDFLVNCRMIGFREPFPRTAVHYLLSDASSAHDLKDS